MRRAGVPPSGPVSSLSAVLSKRSLRMESASVCEAMVAVEFGSLEAMCGGRLELEAGRRERTAAATARVPKPRSRVRYGSVASAATGTARHG